MTDLEYHPIIAVALRPRGEHRSPSVGGQGPSPFGIALEYAGNDRPWSFGAVPLCTAKPAHVTIDKLVPLGGNGDLRIVSYATRTHVGKAAGVQDNTFGSSQRDLVTEGFSPTQPPRVDATCPPDPSASYGRDLPGGTEAPQLTVRLTNRGRRLPE